MHPGANDGADGDTPGVIWVTRLRTRVFKVGGSLGPVSG